MSEWHQAHLVACNTKLGGDGSCLGAMDPRQRMGTPEFPNDSDVQEPTT